jgi:hypothetical protein
MAEIVFKDPASLSNPRLLKGIEGLLLAQLPQAELLESRLETKAGPVRIDLWIKARIGRLTKVFLCELKSKGEPKYLFNAIGQLSLAAKQFPQSYPVVVVPTLSQEGRQVMRESGMGYITLDGEASLKFDSVFVERSPVRPSLEEIAKTQPRRRGQSKAGLAAVKNLLETSLPKRKGRYLNFPFTAKASRVVRAFLQEPDKAWTVRALAEKADVALRLALMVVNTLDEKGYVKKERGATRLLKLQGLLEAWAQDYRFLKVNEVKSFYCMARNFAEFQDLLRGLPPTLKENYCLTMYGGSALVAPYLRFNTNYLFVRGELDEWAKALDLRPVQSGPNLMLAIAFDDSVFSARQEIQGIRVASNIQLYLDLYNLNDRAREQAEVLLKRIAPRKP